MPRRNRAKFFVLYIYYEFTTKIVGHIHVFTCIRAHIQIDRVDSIKRVEVGMLLNKKNRKTGKNFLQQIVT